MSAKAYEPILEIPATIQDADRPIGTHIFTAMERVGTDIRWSVVSLVGGRPAVEETTRMASYAKAATGTS